MADHQQGWTPDTHDAYFVLAFDDELDEPVMTCVEAFKEGVKVNDPGAFYAKVLQENINKNIATATVIQHLPDHMKKAVLDEDGDPTDQVVVKLKHTPIFNVHPTEGSITISVPGADAELVATLDAKIGDLATVIPHKVD